MLFQSDGIYEKVSPWEDWLDSQEVIELNDSNLIRLLTAVYTSSMTAIDLETTGLDPLQNEIALIQIAVLRSEGENPEDLKSTVFIGRPTNKILSELVQIIENPDILKILFNAKFDLSFIRASVGRRILPRNIFDVMLASQLVTAGDFIPEAQLEQYLARNSIKRIKFKQGGAKYFDEHGHEIVFEKDTAKQTRPLYPTHSLQQVAHRYLEVWLDKSMQVSDWTRDLSTDQLRYAAKDALVLLPLYGILGKLIKLNKLEKTARIEFDCIPAVIEIELAGMPFDVEKAQSILQDVIEKQNLLYQELQKAIPNPNSSVQVQEYLTKFSGPSGIEIDGEIFPVNSGDENLSRIASRLPEGHELKDFIHRLQEYRSLKKKSDFLQKWLNLLHPKTKRLHTDLKQINPQGVGRFSAANPNLQQVGRDPEIRELFRAEPGKSLVIADYSAIEMRIIAQLSRDKTLIQAFKEGIDVHKFTASRISGKPLDEITKEERQASKASNFGLIYGMTGKTLQLYAETGYGVKMTLEEAQQIRESFFKTYPDIEKWHRKQMRLVSEKGFSDYWTYKFGQGFVKEKRPSVRTLSGRLRVWPVEKSASSTLKKVGAVTEAFNTPDQGTGADIIKLALALLYEELVVKNIDAAIIGCVHDEILLEVSSKSAGIAQKVLESNMLKAAQSLMPNTPLEIEAHIGDSWAEK